MLTEKQLEANRRNARLSTGPRTEEGRAVSRLNAVKHGLTGHLDVMTADEKEAHDAFCAPLVEALKPADPYERQLAHSIAESHWRLDRVATIENNIFAADAHEEAERPKDADEPAIDRALASARTFTRHPEHFNLLTVYEMRLHRKVQADLKQFRDLQAARLAADEKAKADAKAREREAFHECAVMLNLDEREGKSIDFTASTKHRNGFVFSNSRLKAGMEYTARLGFAKEIYHEFGFPVESPLNGSLTQDSRNEPATN